MKTKTLFKIFLVAVLMVTCKLATAQIYLTSSSSSTFEFPNGPTEWSKPVLLKLTSEKFEKKGLEGVPLEFKIKVTKKASSKLAPCKYEVEVKNLSDKQGISFEARNDYTDPSNKYIYHKVKLKAGETATFDIAYWHLGWDVKTMEGCTTCSWNFVFVEVKPN
ncbi:hypothetical protein [Pedobacter montanisoli]|uniref:Uncharacterized protein n=1 Tax=Pedobacter montanisoli TaxID=2923277 RepID=A0ABS9ZWJ8_9SPHI|nr:hypothetical protein [Pedobacter montanisoli]MCJ0742689.1 hypothetical protein [Pedobacter montanisoli]